MVKCHPVGSGGPLGGAVTLRPLCLLVSLLLLVSCGHAQNDRRRVNKVCDSAFFVAIDTSYSFIRYDSNHLVIPADSSQLRRFAAKWYGVLRSGSGTVNIVQIGASHVQGGTFPHQLRRNFILGAARAVGNSADTLFPVASRGMLFPYSAAVKCNNPFDYKVSRSAPLALTRNVYKEPDQRLGLCGIAVTARDTTAVVGITLTDPELRFSTRSLVLLGEPYGPVSPQIEVTAPDGSPILVDAESVDLQRRRYSFSLPMAVDSFRVVLPCDSGQAFALTGLFLANNRPGVSFHSIGVNGASTSDYINKCPFFTTDLALCKPDLVIFGIGINDAAGPNFDTADFRQRYLQLVDSIRAVSPDCAFIFVTNNDSYRHVKRKYSVNNNGPLVREAFLRVAADCGGAVWDQFTIMGGLSSMAKWTEASLGQRDRVHFTRRGYQLLGDLLSNAIFEAVTALKPAEVKPPARNNTSADSSLQRQQRQDSASVDRQQRQDSSERVRPEPIFRKRSKGNGADNNNSQTNSSDERFIYILD